MNNIRLSVVLATYNEEQNISTCLESVRGLADEIVVVDGTSTDKTAQIAQELGARVIIVPNDPHFHANKEKAVEAASGEWILQLDADEMVSTELKQEIERVIKKSEVRRQKSEINSKSEIRNPKQIQNPKLDANTEDKNRTPQNIPLIRQNVLRIPGGGTGARNEQPGGLLRSEYSITISTTTNNPNTHPESFSGYYIPRRNWFLGRFLLKGGVYPDPVLRLFKKGKGHFPTDTILNNQITTSNVHAQLIVEGVVGKLTKDLIHNGDPSIGRYLKRFNRYTELEAENIVELGFRSGIFSFLDYVIIKPTYWFCMRYLRHKGFMDGYQGFLFALFSALHYPVIYMKAAELSQKLEVRS